MVAVRSPVTVADPLGQAMQEALKIRSQRPKTQRTFSPGALTFAPRLVPRVWGGRALEAFGKALPPGERIGESWEISDVDGGESRVARGFYQGKTLRDLTGIHREALLGRAAAAGPYAELECFPLLLKLLDANDDLSVQVHPADGDLRREGLKGLGKSEGWLILEAKPGARIAHGLNPGVDRARFFASVRESSGRALPPGEIDRLVRWLPVAAGEVVHVPAGTIHAVGQGIVLLEVQETSDITYRHYDWGRLDPQTGKPRGLQLDEAERVTHAEPIASPITRLADLPPRADFAPVLTCPHFLLEWLPLGPGTPGGEEVATTTRAAPGPTFQILAVTAGSMRFSSRFDRPFDLGRGDFALLPAVMGDYTLKTEGAAAVLRISVP